MLQKGRGSIDQMFVSMAIFVGSTVVGDTLTGQTLTGFSNLEHTKNGQCFADHCTLDFEDSEDYYLDPW